MVQLGRWWDWSGEKSDCQKPGAGEKTTGHGVVRKVFGPRRVASSAAWPMRTMRIGGQG